MIHRDRYWFSRTGLISTEACRMALALCYLVVNIRHPLGSAAAIKASHPVANYQPDGILMLLGPAVPSDALINAMLVLSWVLPWTLLLGIFPRISLWGTLLTHLFLRTLGESFSAGWSHGFNVLFLAHIGFLFAPVGQRWSLDAWWRHRRNRNKRKERDGFWAVVLGQWCVALMFLAAFYWKALHNNRPPFAWAHWENMRNQLLYRYEWCGEAVPAFLASVMDSPPLLGLMAAGNLLLQFLPAVSLLFLHRPVLRLLFGFAFVLEEIGLAVVMGLADLHWLPLIAFFVDWDHFLQRGGTPLPVRHRRWKKGYAIGLIAVYVGFAVNVPGVLLRLDVFRLRAYPFSQFSMYSDYMRGPGGAPYVNTGILFTVDGPELDNNRQQHIAQRLKRRFYGATFMDASGIGPVLEKSLELANDPAWTGFAEPRVERITLYRALHIYRSDTAHLSIGPRGIMGTIGTDGPWVPEFAEGTDEQGHHWVEPRLNHGPWTAGPITALDRFGHSLPFNCHSADGRLWCPPGETHQVRYLQVELRNSSGTVRPLLVPVGH